MALSRGDILDLSKLSRRRERVKQRRVLVEGVRSVEAAIDGGAPLELVLVTEEAKTDPRVKAFVAQAVCPVELLSARDLSKIADAATNQGVIAVSKRFVSGSVEDVLGFSRIVILAGVQDPGNVGTLVRTAAWFGIEGILADTATADFESPKVVRASMGGVWDVSLCRINEMDEGLERVQAAGFEIVGADVDGEPVRKWRPEPRTALVLGSEAHGLPRGLSALLDKRVTIEGAWSKTSVESLNVSIAGGILIAHWARMSD